MTRSRLDQALVERGLAASRRSAQALIMAGRVTVDGAAASKPGARVAGEAEIRVTGPPLPFVGRGGVKLAGALETLGLDVTGLRVLDVGSSTGGFTDCLLQRGAAHVVCVDVGRGQLEWRLRNDPRVTILEGKNARYLSGEDLADGGPVQMAVIDVSFISLKLILPPVASLLSPPREEGAGGAAGSILALVKPQFEVGRGRVGRGGIVRSRELRREAVAGVAHFASSMGTSVAAVIRSPITGAEGNIEYFLHLVMRTQGLTTEEIDRHVSKLTEEEPG